MYIRRRVRSRVIWRYSWPALLIFTLYDTALAILYGPMRVRWLDVPWPLVSIVGVAVSFYVGFKNNGAYNRFWEARQLWGGIVNRSRSWTLQVLAVSATGSAATTRPAPSAVQRALVYRQLAWCQALRLHLRRQPAEWFTTVAPLLEATEAQQLQALANPPAQLLLRQAYALHEATGLFSELQLTALMQELHELTALQGGCERIKNTPFPRQYAFSSQVFVWLFSALLPLGMLGEFGKLGHGHYWLAVPFSVLVSWMFVTIEYVGHISEDPFDNSMNDVPLTALCRSIEIDLRQMLGETQVPARLEPIDDILY